MPRNYVTFLTLYLLVMIFGLGAGASADLCIVTTACGSPFQVRQELPGYFSEALIVPQTLDRPMPDGAITLLALPAEAVPFGGSRRGFKVLLANTTGETVAFRTEELRLMILREALDASGQWKPIEHVRMTSWCPGSYPFARLHSEHYWSFSALEYSGPMKTRMRFVLFDEEDCRPPIYSNEFEGSIHPDQFKFDQEYYKVTR